MTRLALALGLAAALGCGRGGPVTPPPATSGSELPMDDVTGDVTLGDTWETPYGLRIDFGGEDGPVLRLLFQHEDRTAAVSVDPADGLVDRETLGFRWQLLERSEGSLRLRVYSPEP